MATLYGSISLQKFGTTDETAIIIETSAKSTTSEKATLPNGQGDIVAVGFHGKAIGNEVAFAVQATGYADEDLVEGLITLSDAEVGGVYMVESVTNTKQQNEWFKGSMTLVRYPEWTPTTGTTTTTTTASSE
jgi:hypothetical protein